MASHGIAMEVDGSGDRVVFLCHGLGGSRNGNTARAVSPALVAEGFRVCRFDFGGGRPADLTITRALGDLREVFAVVAPSRFGLFGSSFGGAVATLFAAERPETEALFLKSPVIDLRALCDAPLGPEGIRRWEREGRTLFPHEGGTVDMPWEFYVDAGRWDIAAAARAIRAPIEIVHGDADRTVPFEGSRELPGRLHVLPGVGHRFLEPGALARVAERAKDFFLRHMR